MPESGGRESVRRIVVLGQAVAASRGTTNSAWKREISRSAWLLLLLLFLLLPGPVAWGRGLSSPELFSMKERSRGVEDVRGCEGELQEATTLPCSLPRATREPRRESREGALSFTLDHSLFLALEHSLSLSVAHSLPLSPWVSPALDFPPPSLPHKGGSLHTGIH